jgi:hypothetical protein
MWWDERAKLCAGTHKCGGMREQSRVRELIKVVG